MAKVKRKSRGKEERGKKIETNVILVISLSDNHRGAVIEINEQTEKAGDSILFSVIDPERLAVELSKATIYAPEDVDIEIDQFFKNTKGEKFDQLLLHATLTIKSNVIHSVDIHSVIKNIVVSDAIRNITKEV
jgi:hypothetical protein